MEIRKTIVPVDAKGRPMESAGERELIYFTVTFNRYRDTSNSFANEILDREEMAECECVLCLPKSYTENGEETPLILSFHGAGGTVCAEKNTVGGLAHVFGCVDAGYAALDVCGAEPHGLTFGCPEHVFAIYKAYRYAIKHFNLSDRVLVTGSSMGGQVAMNFSNTFPNLVTAIALLYPRLNMESFTVGDHFCLGSWDKTALRSDGISTRHHISEIFRFPNKDEWCEQNVAGFQAYRARSFVDQNGDRVVIPPCPIKIWHGLEDKTVDHVISEEFVKSVRRAGCYIEYHPIEGIAHRPCATMYAEMRMWFDRFI